MAASIGVLSGFTRSVLLSLSPLSISSVKEQICGQVIFDNVDVQSDNSSAPVSKLSGGRHSYHLVENVCESLN